VLGELYWYVHQEPPPADANTTEETLKYLKACHKLFESGFLAHDKIVSLDSPILKNIDEGYQYFTSWLSTLMTEGMHVQFTVADCMWNPCRSQFSTYIINAKGFPVLAE